MNIRHYGAQPTERSDTTIAVNAAIRDLRAGKSKRLVFPKGRYHFWPDRAAEEYLFISNNDESLKRIAFPLYGLSGVEIDGDGSEFVFHGTMIPFALKNSRRIILSNFSIDWDRTFHMEAEIFGLPRKRRRRERRSGPADCQPIPALRPRWPSSLSA